LTVIVPFIELWTVQKYWYVPAVVKVKLNVSPAPSGPSNLPSLFGRVPLVTVCPTLSLFVQVTFVPGATSVFAGNLKPWTSMLTDAAAAGADVAAGAAAGELQAAAIATVAMSANAVRGEAMPSS
jgi:hypothetical protein